MISVMNGTYAYWDVSTSIVYWITKQNLNKGNPIWADKFLQFKKNFLVAPINSLKNMKHVGGTTLLFF